jgi:hypothetical protein
MHEVDKPFVITFTSMLTGIGTMISGILEMSGYITPKGADALNSVITFGVGAAMVSLSGYIYHAHNADVTKSKLTQTTISQTTPSGAKLPEIQVMPQSA